MATRRSRRTVREPPVLPTVVTVNGVPAVVTDFLSPKDTFGEIDERIHGYLRAGVSQVWAVHPYDGTVTVYRPGAEPQMFSSEQEAVSPRFAKLRPLLPHDDVKPTQTLLRGTAAAIVP
jgi:Putative restriction endonuclease